MIFSFQPAEMTWTQEEENFQSIAEGAGAVPPQAIPPADAIADDGPPALIPWHIPVGIPGLDPAGGPPMMTNGVHQDYEGDLVDAINASLAIFSQALDDDLPG